jgi:L-threonylcarbamoyladenylate synthase
MLLPESDPRALSEALRALRQGQPVVFATDTVYGVGCDLWNPQAIERLFWAKRRPERMAIPVLVADVDGVQSVAREAPQALADLAGRFWPGGLTLVLRRREEVPAVLCAGGDTVAVRLPDHPFARRLIAAAGGALAVTSANISGEPAPRNAQEALLALQGRVALVVDGGPCAVGTASTLVDLVASPPVVLRQGALSFESLRAVLPELLPMAGA